MFNNNSGFMSNMPPVVKNIIIINFILWLATLAGPGLFARFGLRIDLTDILGMHYWQADKFNLTQMFSYMFMHGGFTHFFFQYVCCVYVWQHARIHLGLAQILALLSCNWCWGWCNSANSLDDRISVVYQYNGCGHCRYTRKWLANFGTQNIAT